MVQRNEEDGHQRPAESLPYRPLEIGVQLCEASGVSVWLSTRLRQE